MNDELIVEHMIKFIIEEEKRILNQKYLTNNIPKKTVVKNMINELERVMTDEN